nr:hypothetical protein [uncultured Caldimonas sp.]
MDFSAGREGAPLLFDPALQVWVAADPVLSAELLAHPACCVCETSALVASLSSGGRASANGLPAGEHRDAEHVVAAMVESLAQHEVREAARGCGRRLLATLGLPCDDEALHRYARLLPGHALGALLGAEPAQLDQLTRQAGECRPAGDRAAPLGLAPQAAGELLTLMQRVMASGGGGARGRGLLGRLGDLVVRRPALDADRIVTRLAQLLYLVHKACARLLRQSVRAWQLSAEVEAWAAHQPSVLAVLVREVRWQAPPLPYAFRVWGRHAVVAGHSLSAGDAMVLQLEPQATAPAGPLGLDRKKAKVLTFGAEPFGSAAQMLAETIAAEAVAGLLAAGLRFHDAAALHRSQTVGG